MLDGRCDGVADAGTAAEWPPLQRAAGAKPVLVVLHQAHSNPGHVGHWLRRHDYSLDIRRHFDGDPLPGTLSDHCGAVIFGGPQSANDSFDFIRREIDWIGVALKEHKPFLGVCLGAQMLARHLGARVDHCRHGHVEIGYHSLSATAAGLAIGGFPEQVYQWHREGFEVPSGGELLATSDGAYPNQAFRYGTAAFGVQFHPEITFDQVNRWSGASPMRLLLRGARPRSDHIDMHLMHSPAVRTWLDGFLSRWIALGPVTA
jgi:GMP synthase (glutamine-hydrolysing)